MLDFLRRCAKLLRMKQHPRIPADVADAAQMLEDVIPGYTQTLPLPQRLEILRARQQFYRREMREASAAAERFPDLTETFAADMARNRQALQTVTLELQAAEHQAQSLN